MSQVAAAIEWKSQLAAALRLFGHRNWIVVADSAYPAQSSPGIETVASDSDQVHVLRTVVEGISASSHVRANIYLDHELDFLSEQDAPGVVNYRHELQTILRGTSVLKVPHEQIIHKLDQSAELFRILIIKTGFTVPYTSVFLELDCGYWSADAESRLRAAIANTEPK
jgi:D-ribose pyranose/furanose isomerase RbsD